MAVTAFYQAPLDQLVLDLRHSTRVLRKAPAFATVAILSLALGIGANTAIFSIVNAVILKALPVRDPERLVSLVLDKSARGKAAEPASYYTNPIWEQIRDHQHVLDGVSAYASQAFDIGAGGEVQRVSGVFASGRFFDVRRRASVARPHIHRRRRSPRRWQRWAGGGARLCVLARSVRRLAGGDRQHTANRGSPVHDRRRGPARLLRPRGGQVVRRRSPDRHRAAHPGPGEQPPGCARGLVAQRRRPPEAGADAGTGGRRSTRDAAGDPRVDGAGAVSDRRSTSPIRSVCRRRRLASPGCARTIGPRSSCSWPSSAWC